MDFLLLELKTKTNDMKKLILIPAILLLLSCSKDDDYCECVYYPKMAEFANCEWENSSFNERLRLAYFPQDIQRLKEVAQRGFKCD